MQRIPILLMTLAASGLIWPQQLLWGASPKAAPPAPQRAADVRDVVLGPGGALSVRVVSSTGQPVPGVALQLLRPTTLELLQAGTTGPSGQVRWQSLQGGAMLLHMNGQVQSLRLWTPQAAPPVALRELLMVHQEPVVRGQQPFFCLFGQEPIMLAVLVAAAIAIPIAVHNSGSDAPTGS